MVTEPGGARVALVASKTARESVGLPPSPGASYSILAARAADLTRMGWGMIIAPQRRRGP